VEKNRNRRVQRCTRGIGPASAYVGACGARAETDVTNRDDAAAAVCIPRRSVSDVEATEAAEATEETEETEETETEDNEETEPSSLRNSCSVSRCSFDNASNCFANASVGTLPTVNAGAVRSDSTYWTHCSKKPNR